jgi:Ca2+:H+ antiporter
MTALRAGLLEMVRASIVGVVLANLLVALGLSFLLGGLRYHKQEYNPDSVRAFSSTMVLAWISLGLPSQASPTGSRAQFLALYVIIVAVLYLIPAASP